MPYLNDWADWVRVLGFLVSLYSFVALLLRYRKGAKNWNPKTMDYWYALTMWSFSGCVLCVQSIVLNRPVTPGFVFLIAAILVTGKGVHAKGDWGSNAR